MGRLLDLPLELLELIVGHLHDDKASLGAFSLVSRALLRPSQAQLFKQINVRRIPAHGDGSSRNTEDMRKWTSLDPGDAQVLSYTRTLSLSSGQPLVYPQHLDDILGHLIAFKKVRNLTISLFATHYVRNPLVSPARYFAHFQPTLRSIYLTTCLTNPWDLITFIAFFPLLEDLTIQILDAYDLPALPESEPEGPEPAALSQFRGSLRLFQFRQTNAFVLELLKHRLQYRALSFSDVTIWTGIQELIVACAPTLQVLRFFNLGMGPKARWYPSLNLAPCMGLREIRLSLINLGTSSRMEQHLALLSSIFSPRLQCVTLTLNVNPFVSRGKFDASVLDSKEWETVEEVFLQLAARSLEVIEVVMVLVAMKPPSSVLECSRFMSRFKRVGKVNMRFL